MRTFLIIFTGILLGLSGPRLKIETRWLKPPIGALLLLTLCLVCPAPCHAAPLDAEQIRLVEQLEQRAKAAEKAAATEHADHLAAEAADAGSKVQVAALGRVAADATARADAAEKARAAAVRAKHHAWELLAAVVLGGLLLIVLIGRQVESMLRALGVTALHEVLEIPGLLKSVLKIASLLAIF